jgi:carbamoyltransferase
MYILGINISHHASSCLVGRDGSILYYLEEERISRIKDTHYEKLDNFKFYSIDTIKKYTNSIDYVVFTSFDRHNDFDYIIIDSILDQLIESGIIIKNDPIYERGMHHYYHACNAFYGSTFNESICIVLDGGGSMPIEDNILTKKINYPFREIESIYECSYENGITPLYKHYSYLDKNTDEYDNSPSEDFFLVEETKTHKNVFSDSLSCGDLFNCVCDALKFGGHEAGKIMGLASYGKFLDSSDWFVEYEGEWITRPKFSQFLFQNYGLTNDEVIKVLNTSDKPFDHFNPRVGNEGFETLVNLTYKLQEQTLNHTLRILEKAYSLSPTNNIVMSGGYFLNCVNNYKYLPHIKENGQLYVDPISHDGGTCIGAAKDVLMKKTKEPNITFKNPLTNIYLG